MAAGPNADWQISTEHKVSHTWSVSKDKNILWKTILPEGGQSGIAIWKDRLFLTINKPLPLGTETQDAKGSDIVGYCINTESGEVLWTAPIKGTKKTGYSSLFSNATSPTPVTNGKFVWFTNAGGAIHCYTMEGKLVWVKTFVARTRHAAKQCEPILYKNQFIYTMMLDDDDPKKREMKAASGDRKSDPSLWPWIYTRSFNSMTGEALWTETTGTSVHITPSIGYIGDTPFLYHMRGGGHTPPEKPYGVSMSHLTGEKAGKALWTYDSRSPFAYTVTQFDKENAYLMESGNFVVLDAHTGEKLKTISLFKNVTLRLWDTKKQSYQTHKNSNFSLATNEVKKHKPYPTNHSAIQVGDYHLFMSHSGYCIGRIHAKTGDVEYLQVPTQVIREPGKEDIQLWGEHRNNPPANSRGIKTGADSRSEGNGWGHVTCGSPIVINDLVYFSTMLGMTYVINSKAEVLDESALISINDLGAPSQTWSLSSPSYSRGKIFHRGLKYIVCIGNKTNN